MMQAGMRFRLNGVEHVVCRVANSVLSGTGYVLTTTGKAIYATELQRAEGLGMVDTTDWRALAPGEAVPAGTLCAEVLDAGTRWSETDTGCYHNPWDAGRRQVSVREGFYEMARTLFDPAAIVAAPIKPCDIIRQVPGGRWFTVVNIGYRERHGWYANDGRYTSLDLEDGYDTAPEGTVLCRHCGEAHMPDDEEAWDMDDVCNDCADSYVECERCGRTVHEDDTHDVDGQSWCDDCVRSHAAACNHCGDLFPEDDLEDGYCSSCGDDDVECNDCGHTTERRYTGDWENGRCPDCQERGEVIRSWSYKPRAVFHGGSDGPHYGIELELDGGGESARSARAVMEDNDFWYAKHDGSLNDGFEVVSHPGTLSYHLEEAGWSDLLERALSEDYRSHDSGTCGLHVHISRTAFRDANGNEDAALARLLLLFDMHWSKLLRFSRRTQHQCDRWAQRYSMARPHNDTEAVQAARDFKMENGGSRYYSVNLQNDNTVEIRMFRGTLREETFYATIEMCDALRRIATETTTAELVGLTWSAMRKRWFDTYKYLPSYLTRRFRDEPQVEEDDEEMPEVAVLGDGDEAAPPEPAPSTTTGEWTPCGTTMPPAGTPVRIRSWDDMVAQYGQDGVGDINFPGRTVWFAPSMRRLCGSELTVPGNRSREFPCDGYTIIPEMLERRRDRLTPPRPSMSGVMHDLLADAPLAAPEPVTWVPCGDTYPPRGTTVRVRSWDDMEGEYGLNPDGSIDTPGRTFSPDWRDMCGDTFTVCHRCGSVHSSGRLTSHMFERQARWQPATTMPPTGTLVRFRSWADMAQQYGGSPNVITVPATFTRAMEHLCGRVINVPETNLIEDIDERFHYAGFAISKEMLEVLV